MNRYGSTSITVQANEKRRKSTTIFPVIPLNPNTDIYIRTTSIERLDKLAHEFYGDATIWWIIATANNIGLGSLVVAPNTKLRIPSNNNAMDILNNYNKTR
jgi:hypothetical protein